MQSNGSPREEGKVNCGTSDFSLARKKILEHSFIKVCMLLKCLDELGGGSARL